MNLIMTWEDLCADPSLNDLPYKIELDRFGRIVMSPTTASHGRFQSQIAVLLQAHLPGWIVITECGVETAEGTRVPDVVAFPLDRCPDFEDRLALPVAPDICVEVYSRSNTEELLAEKRRLYADGGCLEFWICSKNGELTFLGAPTGRKLDRSGLCPTFPRRLPRP